MGKPNFAGEMVGSASVVNKRLAYRRRWSSQRKALGDLSKKKNIYNTSYMYKVHSMLSSVRKLSQGIHLYTHSHNSYYINTTDAAVFIYSFLPNVTMQRGNPSPLLQRPTKSLTSTASYSWLRVKGWPLYSMAHSLHLFSNDCTCMHHLSLSSHPLVSASNESTIRFYGLFFSPPSSLIDLQTGGLFANHPASHTGLVMGNRAWEQSRLLPSMAPSEESESLISPERARAS